MAVTLGNSAIPPSRIQTGENVIGAILFFSYVLAALYFTSLILLGIYSAKTQIQSSSKLKRGEDRDSSHGRSRRADQAYHDEAFRFFCALALASFTILSWNMLKFLIVSYSGWSSARGLPMTLSLNSIDKVRHELHYVWTWATASSLFQTFAEDLVSEPARWKVVRAALVYSYTWNSWMSALGHALSVPNLWAYFILDQILPVSFTQNLFCAALTLTTQVPRNIEHKDPNRNFLLCLRLVGLLCYLMALYWIPSTIDTTQFFPTLFALRLLLLTPYLVDYLAYRPTKSTRPSSISTTILFNKSLVVVTIAALTPIDFSRLKTLYYFQRPTLGTNYATAALSNDMVVGILGGAALFFLNLRQSAWVQ